MSEAAGVIGVIFGAGLMYWGHWFGNLRRTTMILYGNLGGGVFVLAADTPAALGLLADISERFPADRGAIMGLYSVFLAIGQIVGALIGGIAAAWRGIDGMLVATAILLVVALIPLAQLRRDEDELVAQ